MDFVIARFDYTASSNFGTPFKAGEIFTLIEKSNNEWSKVMRNDRSIIFVPANYVQQYNPPTSTWHETKGPARASGKPAAAAPKPKPMLSVRSHSAVDIKLDGSIPKSVSKTDDVITEPDGEETFVSPISSSSDDLMPSPPPPEKHPSPLLRGGAHPEQRHSEPFISHPQPLVSQQQHRNVTSQVTVVRTRSGRLLPGHGKASTTHRLSMPVNHLPGKGDMNRRHSAAITENSDLAKRVSDVPPEDAALTEVGGRSSVQRIAGYLNRKSICGVGGKKAVHRNWTQFYCILVDKYINFYKDKKSTFVGKISTLPLYTILLHGVMVTAVRDTRKKHVFQLACPTGEQINLQADSMLSFEEWTKAIVDVSGIALTHPSVTPPVTDARPSVFLDEHDDAPEDEGAEKGRIRKLLANFFSRRPPPEAIANLVKEQYFGVSLKRLCEREKRRVPFFVELMINMIEQKGVDSVGLYRVSGNASQVQKLRYAVDHEDPLEPVLEKMEDVNILTGALKLFFRELPEPVVPFASFDPFINASKVKNAAERTEALRDAITKLPPVNFNVLKLTLEHLSRVGAKSSVNKMQYHNIAIVFGPTLLRPEIETAKMAIELVHQSTVVELCLQEIELFNALA